MGFVTRWSFDAPTRDTLPCKLQLYFGCVGFRNMLRVKVPIFITKQVGHARARHRLQACTRCCREHHSRSCTRLCRICRPRIIRTSLWGNMCISPQLPIPPTSKYAAALARSTAMVAASDAAGATCRSDSMSHTGGGVQAAPPSGEDASAVPHKPSCGTSWCILQAINHLPEAHTVRSRSAKPCCALEALAAGSTPPNA